MRAWRSQEGHDWEKTPPRGVVVIFGGGMISGTEVEAIKDALKKNRRDLVNPEDDENEDLRLSEKSIWEGMSAFA